MLREQASQLPRIRAVLVEELALAVLGSEPVRLALALLRERDANARLTLALRLADLCDAAAPLLVRRATKE